MASRPAPLSALRVCKRLSKNSIRRLQSAIECSENVLENNVRLTNGERDHYAAAIACAREMLAGFERVQAEKLPKAPPKTKRKIGRPSNKEIAKREAERKKRAGG